MQITGLKFKNGSMWNPETAMELEDKNNGKFVLNGEFATTTYQFSKDWKTCTITNINKDTNCEMKPLMVEVDFVEFA